MGPYQMYAVWRLHTGRDDEARPMQCRSRCGAIISAFRDIDAAQADRSNATADRWSTARWKSPAANSSRRASIRKARWASRLSANAERNDGRLHILPNPMSRGQIVRWALHEAQADYEQVLLTHGFTIAEPHLSLAILAMGKARLLVHRPCENGDRIITECAADRSRWRAETAAPSAARARCRNAASISACCLRARDRWTMRTRNRAQHGMGSADARPGRRWGFGS